MRKDPKRLFRLRRPCKQEHDDVGVLGLTPCHHRGKSQVRQTDQVWYHHQLQVSSLAVDLQWCYCPLHYLRREKREEKRKRRKFYIYPDVTHTHPAEPGKPWKARGRKKRTHDGPTAKNSAGGEGNRRTSGTNLHGETDLTKTEHTPKPNDTLRRSQQEGY